MRAFRDVLLTAVGIFAFSAQTAPTNQPANDTTTKVIRHLEFSFVVDYQRNGAVDTGAIGTRVGNTTQSLMSATGRQGTMLVDVVAVAKDGGLVVRAAEQIQNQPRQSQSFLCAVYSSGQVICPPNLPISDAEDDIMSFLGQTFFDPNIIDQNGKWQRAFSNDYVSVVSSFVGQGDLTSNPVHFSEHSQITALKSMGHTWNEDATVVYDQTMAVPITVHDVAQRQTRGNSELTTTMDFKLTSDSFAKNAP